MKILDRFSPLEKKQLKSLSLIALCLLGLIFFSGKKTTIKTTPVDYQSPFSDPLSTTRYTNTLAALLDLNNKWGRVPLTYTSDRFPYLELKAGAYHVMTNSKGQVYYVQLHKLRNLHAASVPVTKDMIASFEKLQEPNLSYIDLPQQDLPSHKSLIFFICFQQ